MNHIPKFNKYACQGDTVSWSVEGFDIVARIEYDYLSEVCAGLEGEALGIARDEVRRIRQALED